MHHGARAAQRTALRCESKVRIASSKADAGLRGRSRVRAVAATLAGAVAASAIAHAEQPPLAGLSIAWDVPAGCPDAAELERRIRRHLPEGYRGPGKVAASGTVEQQGGRYRLELRLSGTAGDARRSASAATCTALADLAALLVALALDPEASLSADQAQPEQNPLEAGAEQAPAKTDAAPLQSGSPPVQPSPAVPAPAPPREPAQPPPPSEHVRFSHGEALPLAFDAGAALRLEFGLLPQSPAFGVQLALGLRLGPVRVAGGLALFPDAEVRAERYAGARLIGSGLLGELAVRIELVRAPFSLAPVLSFEVGQLAVETRGISSPARGTALWTAAGLGAHAGVRIIGGLELGADFVALAPFARPSWFVRVESGDVPVFTSSSLVARIALGLTYLFE